MSMETYLGAFPDTLPYDPDDEEDSRQDVAGAERDPSTIDARSRRAAAAIMQGETRADAEIEAWVAEQKRRFIEQYGYTEGPILDATLGLMKINKRLEATYRNSERTKNPNLDVLKAIRDNSKQIVSNIESMDEAKNALTSNDIACLHANTMKEAEDYIREHIGEFSWGCPSCSTVITPGGVPHWALAKDNEGQWVPWNPELIKLVDEGRIKLSEAAFVLRTSIEGLMIVAEERRHRFSRRINKNEEERLLRERMMAEE